MASLQKSLAFSGQHTTRRGGVKVSLTYKSSGQLPKRVDRMTKSVTLRQAQYVRKVAKNSVRTTKSETASKPGKPIRSRTGAYKRNIRYDYDPRRRIAYVGPTRLNKRVKDQPNTLEFGGRGRVVIRSENTGRARRRFGRYRVYRGRATIKKRPTMALALEKSIPRFATMYQGAL